MSKVTVTLRVVTPLFLGGAEPRGAPAELRAPSVRGALRWWLRAALAGCGWAEGDFTATAALWQEEARVFGSVDPETGQASPVILSIHDSPDAQRKLPQAEIVKTRTPPPPPQRAAPAGRKPGRPAGPPVVGHDYLLYGMHAQGPLQARRYYLPGGEFTLELRTRLGARGAHGAFVRACAALWLLTALGALGARTRRGAGCLAVVHCEGDWPPELPLPLTPPSTPGDLRTQLQAGLAQVRRHLQPAPSSAGAKAAPEAPAAAPFTILHPDYLEIFVLDKALPLRPGAGRESWQAALDEVGEAFAHFRQTEGGADTQAIKRFIQTGAPPAAVERAAFGLPLPFFFPALDGQRNIKAGVNWSLPSQTRDRDKQNQNRSASPLLLHFSPLAGGALALVLLVSYSALLPPSGRLTVSSGGRATAFPPGSVDDYGRLVTRLQDALESDLRAPFRMVRYGEEAAHG